MLEKLNSIQTTTWITHAIATAFVPFVLGIVFQSLLLSTLVATILAGYFVFVREPADEAKHRAIGNYDVPDAQGITPRIDQWGDVLGPISVAVTYWLALLLTYV